jgi:hypothetical protein
MCAVRCLAPYPRTLNRNRANKGDGCDGERAGRHNWSSSPKGMSLHREAGQPDDVHCCSKGMLACCISTCCGSSSWHSLRAVDGARSNQNPSKPHEQSLPARQVRLIFSPRIAPVTLHQTDGACGNRWFESMRTSHDGTLIWQSRSVGADIN